MTVFLQSLQIVAMTEDCFALRPVNLRARTFSEGFLENVRVCFEPLLHIIGFSLLLHQWTSIGSSLLLHHRIGTALPLVLALQHHQRLLYDSGMIPGYLPDRPPLRRRVVHAISALTSRSARW